MGIQVGFRLRQCWGGPVWLSAGSHWGLSHIASTNLLTSEESGGEHYPSVVADYDNILIITQTMLWLQSHLSQNACTLFLHNYSVLKVNFNISTSCSNNFFPTEKYLWYPVIWIFGKRHKCQTGETPHFTVQWATQMDMLLNQNIKSASDSNTAQAYLAAMKAVHIYSLKFRPFSITSFPDSH